MMHSVMHTPLTIGLSITYEETQEKSTPCIITA